MNEGSKTFEPKCYNSAAAAHRRDRMIQDSDWKEAPPLPADFFDRPANDVAPNLIGCYFFVEIEGSSAGGMIVETEVYNQTDYASHCYFDENKRTRPDCGPMFFAGGSLYLYWNRFWPSVNFVCDRADFGSAVLIRALEPAAATEAVMRKRREQFGPAVLTEFNLCNGPQNVGQALGIGEDLYRRSQASPVSLFTSIFDLRMRNAAPEIVCGPRIGIDKQLKRESKDKPAGSEALNSLTRHWRFGFGGSKYLSKGFPQDVTKKNLDRF